MTSTTVLSAALADPKINSLRALRDTTGNDPEAELRKQLKVGVLTGSYLLEVSMTSISPTEAATIVNAVVNAYLASAAEWSYGMTNAQIKNLESYQRVLQAQSDEKEDAWLALAEKANIDLQAPDGALVGSGRQGLPVASRSRVTNEEYKRIRSEIFRVNIELSQAEAILSMREAEVPVQQTNVRSQRRVDQLIRADPEIVRMAGDLEKAKGRLDDAIHLTRNESDPSRNAARKKLAGVQEKYDALFRAKREDVMAQLDEQGGEGPSNGIREARQRVQTLRASKATYDDMLSKIEIMNRQEGSDAVKIALVREALASISGMKDQVVKRLEQLKFDSKEDARISRISDARTSGIPFSDNRTRLLVVTPLVLLVLVAGLFVMLEVKIGRVSDLDDLSKQLPVEVFAVPMLPGPRLEPGQRGAREREGRLQEFLQSLDHLRVALCGEDAVAGTGRCMVITSATGGEGKTTLSAQLAACCGKAGVSTLVIDADMRRATLSRMLNEENSPGLSDVLQGDLAPDEAYVAVPDAGFHLLPAGTPGRDPSWLLKGQRIVQLLTRYRQTFDLILIDTPPVLPVPDALTIGRWTDGVVLTARFDISRLPLVHRARRRISSAGITLLKTVVNGVRTSRFVYVYGGSASGYGYDGYGYGYGAYGARERDVDAPPKSSPESA
jgi:succinoglycan biosynthesis transport protein ExoP